MCCKNNKFGVLLQSLFDIINPINSYLPRGRYLAALLLIVICPTGIIDR